jgi:hypothetical protein
MHVDRHLEECDQQSTSRDQQKQWWKKGGANTKKKKRKKNQNNIAHRGEMAAAAAATGRGAGTVVYTVLNWPQAMEMVHGNRNVRGEDLVCRCSELIHLRSRDAYMCQECGTGNLCCVRVWTVRMVCACTHFCRLDGWICSLARINKGTRLTALHLRVPGCIFCQECFDQKFLHEHTNFIRIQLRKAFALPVSRPLINLSLSKSINSPYFLSFPFFLFYFPFSLLFYSTFVF